MPHLPALLASNYLLVSPAEMPSAFPLATFGLIIHVSSIFHLDPLYFISIYSKALVFKKKIIY